MAATIDLNSSEVGIGRLNDSFFHSEPNIPSIDSNFVSPTDEVLKNIEPFNKFIKIGHANTVSIPKNRDDIELFLNRTGMDIFANSETNIHKNTPKTVFDIPNYRFYHKDRDVGRLVTFINPPRNRFFSCLKPS